MSTAGLVVQCITQAGLNHSHRQLYKGYFLELCSVLPTQLYVAVLMEYLIGQCFSNHLGRRVRFFNIALKIHYRSTL